ncbi:unnamed protein product [Tuber aestivum]|uniref:Uncharacterized protein n=1 Tax=Tuber aestivum TaxID=59557 RepID=A0A292Q0W9_9PEZI|nr:unnamed protein product [Tuber aestivum]
MRTFSKSHSLTVPALRPSIRRFRTPATSGLSLIKTGFEQGSPEVLPKIRQYQSYIRRQELYTGPNVYGPGFSGEPPRPCTCGGRYDFRRNEQLFLQKQDLLLEKATRHGFLTGMILNEKIEMMKDEGRYNIRGALQFLVFSAYALDIIGDFRRIQNGLNNLAATPKFIRILEEEAHARGLVPKEIAICVHDLYQKVEERSYPIEDIITIRSTDFGVHDRAALVVFMKLQNVWTNALFWREEATEEGAVGHSR